MATKEKNVWILIVFILCGLVIGGLLGEIATKIDFLWWLGYGQSFGLQNPIILDLNIVTITFGLMFKVNIASIIRNDFIHLYLQETITTRFWGKRKERNDDSRKRSPLIGKTIRKTRNVWSRCFIKCRIIGNHY